MLCQWDVPSSSVVCETEKSTISNSSCLLSIVSKIEARSVSEAGISYLDIVWAARSHCTELDLDSPFIIWSTSAKSSSPSAPSRTLSCPRQRNSHEGHSYVSSVNYGRTIENALLGSRQMTIYPAAETRCCSEQKGRTRLALTSLSRIMHWNPSPCALLSS